MFDAVVFAGGGCRCFWQAGFWSVAAPRLGLAPDRVGGVSAGAAFACAVFGGVAEPVLKEFKRRAETNPRNVYPRNLLRRRPLFPHGSMYRGAILECLDEGALSRLHQGPEVRVFLGRPPARLGVRAALLAGAVAFQLEQLTLAGPHAVWGRRLGFRGEVVSVRTCRTPDELADLILASSCTPPLLPLYRRDGRVVLDGGIIDNAPVETVPEARRTLVLLTRPIPDADLPRVPGRRYVGPSRPVPVARWDYTSPERLQATFDLGRRDAETFAASCAP